METGRINVVFIALLHINVTSNLIICAASGINHVGVKKEIA